MPPSLRKLKSALIWLRRSPHLFLTKTGSEIRRRSGSAPAEAGTIKLGDVAFPYDLAIDPRMMSLIYFGDYGLEIAMTLKRFLRPGMTFVDVGANVGYFSALGLSLVGKSGHVHAFEPVPPLFAQLQRVARANSQHDLVCNMHALGETDDLNLISISGSTNAGWNTIVPGFMSDSTVVETLSVKIQRLDEYLDSRNIRSVDLIKIDVEGFEFPVLRGSQGFFRKTSKKPPIICEVAPGAYSRLGCSLRDLNTFLEGYGYRSYDPVSRKLIDVTTLSGTTDVLFLSS
jgi:FkbM family methyltransferase